MPGSESYICWYTFKPGELLIIQEVTFINLSNAKFKYICKRLSDNIKQEVYEPDLKFAISPANVATVPNNASPDCAPKLKVVDGLSIKNIDVNIYKRIVTVVFKSGHVEQVHCAEGDAFDVRIGVAIALASARFGSKSKFHKFVDKAQKFVGKEPKTEPKKVTKSKSKKSSK